MKNKVQQSNQLPALLIPGVDMEAGSCVFKLHYGSKYVIIKGKTMSGVIYLFEKGYAHFLAFDHSAGDKRNVYYFKFYSYIKSHPNLQFKIEMLLESENAYQLLKMEQIALNISIKDKNCLNNNLTAYIPQYRATTQSYGWINKGSVLSFKRYLKNN
jgi:hypothetical protein